jgi:hypothetical protein
MLDIQMTQMQLAREIEEQPYAAALQDWGESSGAIGLSKCVSSWLRNHNLNRPKVRQAGRWVLRWYDANKDRDRPAPLAPHPPYSHADAKTVREFIEEHNISRTKVIKLSGANRGGYVS